jgi:hypothetical protein
MHFEKFEYLREFEFIFEKALAPSGAQDGCFDEKNEGRKSRDTVPLMAVTKSATCSINFGFIYDSALCNSV